jgi:hypothetical protein
MARYCTGADTPRTRAIMLASTAGFALSGNIKTFIPTIPISLMIRTTAIALASAVRGRKAAATKARSDERIALKTDCSLGSQYEETLR